MRVLVAGGDGYIGWPLSLRLASKCSTDQILIVDNCSRRSLVKSFGGASLLPIKSLDERVESYRFKSKKSNLNFLNADVSSAEIESIIQWFKPDVVYHLAQIPSASFSMHDVECSIQTMVNNESANMRILWAVRKYCPQSHIIKLGSFGEYCKAGIDIAEGYFIPQYKDKVSGEEMPYPRQADDVYHITKINDSNFVSLACRKWGLRVTDVMQSTVFGTQTVETKLYDDLGTRFDYDPYFGTVLNRFVVQVVAGHDLTVYGTGHQRTGLMALEDTVTSLCKMAYVPPKAGGHRVINHVTEKRYSINEIAALVVKVANEIGLNPKILREEFNPRDEQESFKRQYDIETSYLDALGSFAPMESVIRKAINDVMKYKRDINIELLAPKRSWSEIELNSINSSPPLQRSDSLTQELQVTP